VGQEAEARRDDPQSARGTRDGVPRAALSLRREDQSLRFASGRAKAKIFGSRRDLPEKHHRSHHR